MDRLIDKIKEILLSPPLDILSSDEDTITESVFELVSKRDDGSIYIGSANMFIASSLTCYVSLGYDEIKAVSDEDLDNFATYWNSILVSLQNEKFIRYTKENRISNTLNIAVDNTTQNNVVMMTKPERVD